MALCKKCNIRPQIILNGKKYRYCFECQLLIDQTYHQRLLAEIAIEEIMEGWRDTQADIDPEDATDTIAAYLIRKGYSRRA